MREPVSRPWRRRVALALLLGWLALIYAGSSSRPPEAVTGIGAPDWLLHGIEYGILGLLAARYLHLRTLGTGAVLLVVLPAVFALLYGITDEWHQSMVPGRDPSVADALADLVGGLLGGLAYRILLVRHLARPTRAPLAVAVACLIAAASAPAAPSDDPVAAAAASIRPADVHATAAFLSSPALGGRDAPSGDLDAAARYLAERFRAAGLVPGGKDGSWFQPVPLAFRVNEGRSLLRLLGEDGATDFAGEDVVVPRESPDGIGGGPVAFAGYGISAPEVGRDDYAGLDVRGCVVVVFDGFPGRDDPKSPFRRSRDAKVRSQAWLSGKARVAAKKGAVGLVVTRGPMQGTVDRLRLADGTFVEGGLAKVSGGYRVRMPAPRRLPVEPTDVERVVLADGSIVTLRGGRGADVLDLPAAEVDRFFPLEAVAKVETGVVPLPDGGLEERILPGGELPDGPLPVVRASATAAGALIGVQDLKTLQEKLEERSMSFLAEGRTGVVRVETRKVVRESANVLGLLPGADRADEVLVVTAHYDHVGRGRGGEIYHGADDNASGTAVLATVAEALGSLPASPSRSVLFVALTAEEKGLLGSRHFVANPPLPLDSILANLNMDMVGRGPADEVEAFVGPLGSDLHRILAGAAESAQVRVEFETVGPVGGKMPPATGREKLRLAVPKTRLNLFGRSDHVEFYRKGIPTAFLFGGIHEDYHRPTDTADKLCEERLARISRLVLFAAWRLATDGLALTGEAGGETGGETGSAR